MKIISTAELYNRYIITYIQKVNKNKTSPKFQAQKTTEVGTGWNQWNRKKKTTKESSTGKVKDRRETKTQSPERKAI